MSATIKVFQVGDKCFKHVMSSDHERVELRDEDDRTLLTYSEDDKVYDQRGRLGDFHIDFSDGRPRWLFSPMPSDTCLMLSPDLPSAKLEVSRRYIAQLGLLAA